MARPIWTGTISFGLLQVPVRLMTAERRADLHFRLLDSRDNAPIRYERINADTGEEVPWKEIVKAFEYDKGNYVVIDEKDFKEAAPDSAESVDIEAFVDIADIDIRYFEKPYYLLPAKRAAKGYVLLRETLRDTGLAGLARVVIRTREHLALVIAEEQALVLMLLRYPQELIDQDTYDLPDAGKAGLKINAKELDMAAKLVESMREEWKPSKYKDDYREKLAKVIERRLASKDVVERDEPAEEAGEGATASNVVDFMALLKKSIAENKRQPAKSDSAASRSKGKSSAKAKSSTKKKSTKARTTAKKKAKSGGGKKTAARRKAS
ncbi:MAG: Ku protein [Rhodanobacteraceae bacterium]